MRKEVGSIFPLSDMDILQAQAQSETASYADGKIYYSLCREAFFDIAESMKESNKTVLIPAFTCQTVITPFEVSGWNCVYYPIQKNLRIDSNYLSDLAGRLHPAIVVAHPYFGRELNEEEVSTLRSISEQGAKILLDLTQCIFSAIRYPFVSFTTGSYRKWFPIPDGGFLECNDSTYSIAQPETEHHEFTERMTEAMYLRGQYFCNGEQRTKSISIWLNKYANSVAECNTVSHKMSRLAYNLLKKEDKVHNQNCRFKNFAYLFRNINENDRITKACRNLSEVTTAPLYFTIYVDDRSALQRLLAQESVYAPVIWPVEDEKVLINETVSYIYEHLLAIPCDQRYDEKDMQRAVEIINEYSK